MARRLSEDGSNSVAVIEAGGFYEIDGGNATEVPMYLFNYFLDNGYMKNPLFDWYQYTVPQPVRTVLQDWFEGVQALTGICRVWRIGRCFICLVRRLVVVLQGERCCIIGTCPVLTQRRAAHFVLILLNAHSGSKGAYQKWADHVGDQSYTWDNWLPYFKKSVKFSDPSTNPRPDNATANYDSDAFSANGGPVHVAYPHWTNAISSWVDKTFEALGIPLADGFSNGNLLGRSYITVSIVSRA
jgi:5'-oxoaverantin cyclase/versicolorin B synthase